MFYKKQFITAGNLAKIIEIPKENQNEMYEILYRPIEKKKNKEEILSIIDSLSGIIKNEEMSLEDYKEERLSKYEIID